MSEQRKTRVKQAGQDNIDLRSEGGSPSERPLSPEQAYLQRKAEVTRQDHEEFLRYQQEKKAAERLAAETKPTATRVNRRNFLTVVASTAAVGEAAALGYTIKNQGVPAHGLKHAGDTYTEAQRHNIERELINPKADIGGRGFGNWVLLMPTKLGGGTYAVDLNTNRVPGLDLLLDLRRLQSDLAPSVRLPERRSGARLRVRQQHAGRQELR